MSPFASPPVIVGHRGAPRTAPENTVASYRAAVSQGAAWIEVDARRSHDDVVVLCHDARLSDGRAVVDLDADELAVGGVPRLDEVLEGLPAGIGVDVELKNLPGEPDHDPALPLVALAAEVVRASAPRPLLLSSFDGQALSRARDLLPTVPTGFLYGGGLGAEPAASLAQELGAGVLCPPVSVPLDAEAVAAVHGLDLALLVWTVNDATTAVALAAAGVDALCTDVPGELAAALGPARC